MAKIMNSRIIFKLSLFALVPSALFSSCSDKLSVSDLDNNNETVKKSSFTIVTDGLPEIEYVSEDGTKAFFQKVGLDQSNWKLKFEEKDSLRLYNSTLFYEGKYGQYGEYTYKTYNPYILEYKYDQSNVLGFTDYGLGDTVPLPDKISTWYMSYPAGINQLDSLPVSKNKLYIGTVKFTGQSGTMDDIGKYFCCFATKEVAAKTFSFKTTLVAATSIAIMKNTRDEEINIRFKTSSKETKSDRYIIGMRVDAANPSNGFQLVTTGNIEDGTIICTIPAGGEKYVVIPAGVAFQVVEDGGYIVRNTTGQAASVRFDCSIGGCTYTGLTYGIQWVELYDDNDKNTRWALNDQNGSYIATSSDDQIGKQVPWNPSAEKTEQKWILPSVNDYKYLFENTKMKYTDGKYEFARYADAEKSKVYKNIKTTFNHKGFVTNLANESSINRDQENLYLWTSTLNNGKRNFYLVQHTPADTNMVIKSGYEKEIYHSYEIPTSTTIKNQSGNNYKVSELCFNIQYVLDRQYYNK